MKIIAVGMNYALHNKELGHTHENKEPVIFFETRFGYTERWQTFLYPRLFQRSAL